MFTMCKRRHFLGTGNQKTSCLLLAITLIFAISKSSCADEISRIWVDASGTHSVQAMMLSADDDKVHLLRVDGGKISLPIDQLSQADIEYIEENRATLGRKNSLRAKPPKATTYRPFPQLRMPAATQPSPTDQPFALNRITPLPVLEKLPVRMPADPPRIVAKATEFSIAVGAVDFNDQVSRPTAVSAGGSRDGEPASVGISISNYTVVPGEQSRQQLVQISPADRQAVVAMQHDAPVRLLDHHLGLSNSLVLMDQSTLGEGGELALVSGWDRNNVQVLLSRPLPTGSLTDPAQTVHWARILDPEHVLIQLNDSIVACNFVSGKAIYRIDNVASRYEPALSGGRHYLAISRPGSVDIRRTDNGKSLGQILVEKQHPGLAFSSQSDCLAITTSRRLRVWSLPDAALQSDVTTRENIGQGRPTWVDHDLILSSTGTLISQFRGIAIWKYDVAGAIVSRIGDRVAVFRKGPGSQLATVKLPHATASKLLKRIDDSVVEIPDDTWRVPGKSRWNGTGWTDSVTRMGSLPLNLR